VTPAAGIVSASDRHRVTVSQNEPMDESFARIRVARQEARWRDHARHYKVVIDREVVGRLANGETAECPVGPGKHSIQIKIDLSGSRIISVWTVAGDERTFSCQPKGRAASSFWRTFSRHGWVELHEEK
jgi:hypothetical protein